MIDLKEYSWASCVLLLVVYYILRMIFELAGEELLKKIADILNDKNIEPKQKIVPIMARVLAVFIIGMCLVFVDNVTKAEGDKTEDNMQPISIVEEYILNAENKVFTYDEINNLSDEELFYIRNGIYARRGLRYNGTLYEYYEKFDWYDDPQYDSEEEASKHIANNEWKLINLIKKIEEERRNINYSNFPHR